MSKPVTGRRLAVYMIVNALFWAAVILGVSYVFRDKDWADDLQMWGIAGWVLVNGWLAARVNKLKG